MPDILIRMEMPKSCADCPFEVFGDCNGGKVKFIMDVDDYTSERAPRCPLHELPPHGDLIDLSELQKFPIRLGHYDKEHGDEHFVYGIESLMEYAERLPVVVPAEKGETQ